MPEARSLDLKDRIRAVRFPLSVGVVAIHACWECLRLYGGAAAVQSAGAGGALYGHFLLADILSRISRPLFFLVAGFLWVTGYSPGWASYVGKATRRFHSLVVPYLLWNGIVLLKVACLYFISNGAWSDPGAKPINQYAFLDYLDVFVGFTGYPADFPLWFVRNLIVLAAAAPLLDFVARKAALAGGVAIFALWMVFPDDRFSALQSLFLFYAGCALAQNPERIYAVDRWWKPALAAWTVGVLALVFLDPVKDPAVPDRLYRLASTAGAVVCWVATSRLRPGTKLSLSLIRLSQWAFFVFSVHALFIGRISRLCFSLTKGMGPAGLLACDLAAMTLTVALSVGIAKGVKWAFPRFYGKLTGGRVDVRSPIRQATGPGAAESHAQ